MKKIAYLFAAVVALMSMSSCNDDTTPRISAPTTGSFTVYTPAMANQYIELTNAGQVNIVCNGQPNFGASCITTYAVQLSLSPDFIQPAGSEDSYVPAHGDYVEMRNPGVQSNIMIDDVLIARAITKLQGYTSEDQYPAQDYIPVYLRVRAYVAQLEDATSTVSKNVVCLHHVKSFFSLDEPGFIWLVGEPTKWTMDMADLIATAESKGVTAKVSELKNEIDSKVYHWKGHIDAGKAMFRFYTALGDWESNSIGYKVDDEATDIASDFVDGVYTGSYVAGKGSWNISTWAGGTMEMTVDMNEGTVEFRQVDE